MYFLDSYLDIFPENSGQSAMRTECNFTRKFLPWKSGSKSSGIPVSWLIIAEHLEDVLHRQNIAENHPLLLFRLYMYCLLNNVNTVLVLKLRPCATYKDRLIEKN